METETVRKTVEKLCAVQDLDSRIMRCQKELSDIPRLKKDVESAASSQVEKLENSKSELKTARAGVHKVEMEIEGERQRILKLRDQQIQVKSNEEYRALNNEIGHIEEKIRLREDNVIELMEQVESVEADVADAQSAMSDAEKRRAQEFEKLDARRAKLETELAELKNARASLAKDIDEDWLNRYNVVMLNKMDIALSAMGKDGTCEACRMNLQPQVVHNVKSESSMVSCSFCGRLLYWADEA